MGLSSSLKHHGSAWDIGIVATSSRCALFPLSLGRPGRALAGCTCSCSSCEALEASWVGGVPSNDILNDRKIEPHQSVEHVPKISEDDHARLEATHYSVNCVHTSLFYPAVGG